jgi:general secretion pathway protein C
MPRALALALALLLACASPELEVQVAQLHAELEAEQARNAALEAQVQELTERLDRTERISPGAASAIETLEGRGDGPPADPVEGGCVAEGQAFRLPAGSLDDPQQIASSLRSIPHKGADGRIDGFRLSGIRRSSIVASCGFKNGDVLHAVEAMPLTSVDEAMAAWQTLQQATTMRFDLTRRGQGITVEIRR